MSFEVQPTGKHAYLESLDELDTKLLSLPGGSESAEREDEKGRAAPVSENRADADPPGSFEDMAQGMRLLVDVLEDSRAGQQVLLRDTLLAATYLEQLAKLHARYGAVWEALGACEGLPPEWVRAIMEPLYVALNREEE